MARLTTKKHSEKLAFGSPEWRAKYNKPKASVAKKASAKMNKEIAAREGYGFQTGKMSATIMKKARATKQPTPKPGSLGPEGHRGPRTPGKHTSTQKRFNPDAFDKARRSHFAIPTPGE